MRRHGRWIATLAICFAGLAFAAAYEISFTVRAPVRWALFRGVYKRQVRSQPEQLNGELKHIDWDGWGFAGADTEVYLVFDPKNSLAEVAAGRHPGKVAGVPCAFWYARRLEKDWYAVVYFTDQGWGDCGV